MIFLSFWDTRNKRSTKKSNELEITKDPALHTDNERIPTGAIDQLNIYRENRGDSRLVLGWPASVAAAEKQQQEWCS